MPLLLNSQCSGEKKSHLPSLAGGTFDAYFDREQQAGKLYGPHADGFGDTLSLSTTVTKYLPGS
jgi:hypothetical protein